MRLFEFDSEINDYNKSRKVLMTCLKAFYFILLHMYILWVFD